MNTLTADLGAASAMSALAQAPLASASSDAVASARRVPGTPAASVEFDRVSKRFATGAVAIEELNLKILAGEFLTLLGPSGSGKTTALNLLAGFLQPSTGRILIDGKEVSDLPAHKRNIGVVFQHYALFPHMTVRENIAFPLVQRKLPRDEIGRRVDQALATVSLELYAQRLPSQLSGGQQQRVAVARAISFHPSLLLMDEPLGALDKKLRESVQLEIKRMHKDLGVTIVFVTHDQEEALVMSDRIAVFNGGRIHQIGSATQLYDEPDSQFVAQFLGDSNCWVGELGQSDSGSAEVLGAGWRVVAQRVAASPQGGRVAAVVRPERCKVLRRGERIEGWNHLPARIQDVVYLGSLRRVVTQLESGGEATVACQPDVSLPPELEVTVAFPPGSARIVPAASP